MFAVMHPARKYSPARYLSAGSPAVTVLVLEQPKQAVGDEREEGAPQIMFPPSNAKIRHSKAKGVKAIRKQHSPPKRSLDVFAAAAAAAPPPAESQGARPDRGAEGDGAAPRSRKRAYRPPDVRTIFESRRDPRVKEEKGEGHVFRAEEESGVGWCDVCCQFILQGRLTCTGCKYTCHTQCRDKVSLDCHQSGPAADPPPVPGALNHLNNNNAPLLSDVEKEKELRTQFSKEEVRHKIELYNSSVKDHLKMTLNPSGVYTGFIKVQLELRRPITVRSGTGGPGAEEAFYLPRGAVNTLHISSTHTVRQVIEALLHKFTVADNPAKFALFKRCRREDQVYICKLAEGEQPLFLRLLAGPSVESLSFVLREQPTGEVIWDAFSIPELHNFLRILDREEEEQVQLLTSRYDSYRQKLEEALRAAGHPG
ncbi:ras association domain-containing protein 5 isoform X1 [Scleropages formosus]|uniref:ras association domain-containing protein 5 isoform X1 n=1 Tax=Scleropages formosus TaxID=113540 RepID=UPI0010FA9EE4|nr:ras association domain-containing protein 3 isoform X1 [Scleropages formosus]